MCPSVSLCLSFSLCVCPSVSLCLSFSLCVRPSVRVSVSLSVSVSVCLTPSLDAWLLAAADCLELFPDQLIVAAGEQLAEQGSGAAQGPGAAEGPKKLLFDIIAKHYGGQERSPLLAGRYSDVTAAIHGLLGERMKGF